jgi:hypothetical protein
MRGKPSQPPLRIHGFRVQPVGGVRDRGPAGDGPRRTGHGSSTGTGADRAKRPSRVSNVALSVSAHAM